MAGFVVFHASTVAKHWDLLGRVVVLEDVTDRFDCVKILVALQVALVVQRARMISRTIGAREVDSNSETNLAAAKNIIKECRSFLDFYLRKVDDVRVELKPLFVSQRIFALPLLKLG